ncbi:hypothetical protein AAEX37_01025 [Oligella sp. MSHR50489EDL]|uniref:head completion/stabilization protein n=1 Tax=Oligella sp. MSHR50489EDL TaxID=3139409 RepID=UPI003D817C54
MSFATANRVNRYPIEPAGYDNIVIDAGGFWPNIDVAIAADVMRVTGSVTQTRLVESLRNSLQHIKRLIVDYELAHDKADERAQALFLRAVYFDAKADLIERYRDYDATGSLDNRGDVSDELAADSRRNSKWAVSDLLGKPRIFIEAL